MKKLRELQFLASGRGTRILDKYKGQRTEISGKWVPTEDVDYEDEFLVKAEDVDEMIKTALKASIPDVDSASARDLKKIMRGLYQMMTGEELK